MINSNTVLLFCMGLIFIFTKLCTTYLEIQRICKFIVATVKILNDYLLKSKMNRKNPWIWLCGGLNMSLGTKERDILDQMPIDMHFINIFYSIS